MKRELVEVVLSPLALIALMLTQIAIHRFARALSLIMSFLLSFLTWFFLLAIIELGLSWRYGLSLESAAVAFANIVIFTVAAYCYINVLNIGSASLRIKILHDISESPKGMSEEEILRGYNAQTILSKRLKRLEGNGQIINVEGMYRLGKQRQLLIGKFLIFWRRIILGRASF